MKLGAMLAEVVRSLFRRPATERYPFERQAAPERLRGALTWNPEKCTGCCLCVTDCPAQAIELVVLDKKNKQFVLQYHADRCTFCAQCVQSCRFGCIEMSPEQWELAAVNKEPFTIYYGDGANVETALARLAGANAGAPEEN
jgi:formate hydrogenlyase subunit 6/NADH:ubiquinone oxidoreductase subunit I